MKPFVAHGVVVDVVPCSKTVLLAWEQITKSLSLLSLRYATSVQIATASSLSSCLVSSLFNDPSDRHAGRSLFLVSGPDHNFAVFLFCSALQNLLQAHTKQWALHMLLANPASHENFGTRQNPVVK